MEQSLTHIDPILRLAQPSKRPVREGERNASACKDAPADPSSKDVEGSVAKRYRNLGTISARSLQAICGPEWCAEWNANGMTLFVSNGAALPSQTEIHQVSWQLPSPDPRLQRLTLSYSEARQTRAAQ